MPGVQSKMIRGIMWNAIQKYSSMLVTLLVTMVMARILTPEDFGVVAIAMIVISFLNIFSSMGIGAAIIQRKDLTTGDVNNIYSFSVYLGIFLSVLLFIASWPIAIIYKNVMLRPVCQILCINVFFATINMVPTALMSKNKRFKEMAIRSFFISFVSGVFSVIAVKLGLGLYSLLITPVLSAIGLFFYNLHYYPVCFSLRFSSAPLRSIASYSVYQFAHQFTSFFSSNLDKLIIGKYISQASLGYYDKAHSLTKLPMSTFAGVVTPILHPFLSDYQTDVSIIKEGHNKMTKFLTSLSFPLSTILWFCGAELIRLFYGGQWDAAIFTFQILTLTIPTNMIISTSGAYWQSTNATKYLFWTGLLNSIIIILGYIFTSVIFGTIEAIAWGYVVTCITIFFITYYIMYTDVFKASFLELLKELISPTINVIILVIIYYIQKHLFVISSNILALIVKLVIGVVTTILFVQLTGRYNLIKMIKEKKIML